MGGEGRIDAVLEPPAAEEDVLVQALASGIESGGHVIAVLPQWFPPEGALRLAMARSMLDTDRVAVHETALPPLAGRCCARWPPASPRTCRRRACSPRCCPSSRPSCTSSPGWLVSGLSAPAPTFGQHLASLGPNSAFGVSSWPEPSVHKLSAGEPGVPLPEIVRPSRMVVAPRNGDAAWAKDTVNRALGGLPTAEVEPTPNGPRGGAPRRWSRAWSSRSTPRARRGPAGRARPVGLPLVPRADRPLAVPAVRPPRPPGPASPAAAHQQGGVRR